MLQKIILIIIALSFFNATGFTQFQTKMPKPKLLSPTESWMPGDTVFLSTESENSLKKQTGYSILKGTWLGEGAFMVIEYLYNFIDGLSTGTFTIIKHGFNLVCIDGKIYGFQNSVTLDLPAGTFNYFFAEDNYSEWVGPFSVYIKRWDTVTKKHWP